MILEAPEKFEKAFERLGDEDKKFMDYFDCYELNRDGESEGRRGKIKENKTIGPASDVDWVNARNFVKFLKIFYNVTLKFSGTLYVTSNAFFRELATIYIGLSTMRNKGDLHMAAMAIHMKEKFNKYWGNIENINWLLFVATLLDPRYKLKYVSFGFTTIYEGDSYFVTRMTEKIESIVGLLYKHYGDSNFQQSSKGNCGSQTSNYMQTDGGDDLSELLDFEFAKHLEEEQCVESKLELARYLLDGCEKSGKNFDVLNWWKVNTPKYSVLYKVVRDVLAIPVSTIASESAFSTSGHVIDPFRSSLSPKMVEALICAQDWLRAAPSPVDLHAMIENIKQYEEFEKELEGSSSLLTSNTNDMDD